ncbi:hypothetical protein ACERII_23600 [Evansella sp. AB-rgal1]|uniref:hypothetical protein n=1 Tax=Evansella sp. AB-rgal1 TaxID=3242696 RepID=UPI00359EE5D9
MNWISYNRSAINQMLPYLKKQWGRFSLLPSFSETKYKAADRAEYGHGSASYNQTAAVFSYL